MHSRNPRKVILLLLLIAAEQDLYWPLNNLQWFERTCTANNTSPVGDSDAMRIDTHLTDRVAFVWQEPLVCDIAAVLPLQHVIQAG